MAGALATREATTGPLDGSAEPQAARLFEPGGATLEDLVLEAWEGLMVEGRIECPVCGGSMSAADGCDACGSQLS